MISLLVIFILLNIIILETSEALQKVIKRTEIKKLGKNKWE